MLNDAPLISVIVPVYKVENYLRECIDSILRQTYKNLEIILVDDGSPDGCGAICDDYAVRDDRVKVIHKQNGGLSSARNAGIDIASGEFLAFVDSDDYIAGDMYEHLYNNLVKYNADISTCSVELVYKSRSIKKDRGEGLFILTPEEAIEILLDLNKNTCYFIVSPWNKLYKRYLFENLRYPVGLNIEDRHIAVALFIGTKTIVYDYNAKYYYRQRISSIMHKREYSCIPYEHVYSEVKKYTPKLQEKAELSMLVLGYLCAMVYHPLQNKTIPSNVTAQYVRILRNKSVYLLRSPFVPYKYKALLVLMLLPFRLYRPIYRICLKFKLKTDEVDLFD